MIPLSKTSLRGATVLAETNRWRIADEGYKGKLSLPKLKNRIRDWLRSGEYEAVFFLDLDHEGSRVGYAIFQRQQDALFFASNTGYRCEWSPHDVCWNIS